MSDESYEPEHGAEPVGSDEPAGVIDDPDSVDEVDAPLDESPTVTTTPVDDLYAALNALKAIEIGMAPITFDDLEAAITRAQTEGIAASS